jgi:prepilin peptidase CpaA
MTNSVSDVTVTIPLLVILAVAVVTDARHRKIPNAISLGGAVLGVIAQCTLHGTAGLWLSMSGWVLCLAAFLPFYMVGGMAAGDVKLMAAVGAFLGPVDGLLAMIGALATGGIIGVACIAAGVLRTGWRGGPKTDSYMTAVRAISLQKIPYAGAIAFGAVLTVWQPGDFFDLARNVFYGGWI